MTTAARLASQAFPLSRMPAALRTAPICPPRRCATPGGAAAGQARWLAWASLAWMCTEGAIGLWHGMAAGSIALTGWALGSAVEGLASVIVIWRFTGSRTLGSAPL